MKKFITYLIWIILLVFVGLVLFSNVISIGARLRDVSVYLEIGFYVISVLLFYILLLRPFIIVLFSPYYSISKYCDENENNNGGLKGKAKRLLKYGKLSDDEKFDLLASLKNKGSNSKKKLGNRMYIIYNTRIRKNIDTIVVDSARDTLVLTGASQSHFLDMLIVLVNNFRMIKKIVVLCGFRPTFLRTIKLYAHVFASSLIADGLQKQEITTLLNTSLKGGAKMLTDSAVNGAVNAFFILRIGILTKNFLYAENPNKMKVTILNNSITEAVKLYPQVLASIITSPIKGLASLIKGKNNDQPNFEELAETSELPEVKWNRKK